MEKENLEKTSKEIVEEEITEERLIAILDELDYNELPIWKKNQINNLLDDIKRAKKREVKEKIFFELIELLEND